MKPLWIVQNNLGSTGNFEAMQAHAQATNIPFLSVKIRPFTEDVPEDNSNGPVVVYGSCGMVRAARKTRLARGIFDNEEGFKFKAVKEGYRGALLNHDACVWTVKDFLTQWRGGNGPFFIRGNDDEKHIIGHVTTRDKFQEDIVNRANIPDDYEVVISKPRQIYREFRCWCVDGNIVAGSAYGGAGNKLDNLYWYSKATLDDAISFAAEAVKVYKPHKIFVIDVCDSSDGLAIVELNGFNSAGFYEANIPAIMDAVNICLTS
jgi:ATP-grasp domain, R2K clade family 3